MNHRLAAAWVFFALIISQVEVWGADIDPVLRDQFLQAVRQVPGKSEQVSFRAKMIGTHEWIIIPDALRASFRKENRDPEKPETETANCAIRGPMSLTTRIDHGIEIVRAKNSEYVFQIGRQSAAKAYSLSFIEELGRVSTKERQIQQAENEARWVPFAGWYPAGEPFADFVASPTFQIQRVASENRDGRDLVRIEYERKYSDPLKRASSITDGFLLCDPKRHWVITECGTTTFDGLQVSRASLTFGEPVDGLPIVRTITDVVTGKNSLGEPVSWRNVITIEVIDHEVPREEFYLSHYGLPEPNFRRGWFGTWVWYLIAGVVCFGVAAIIVKRQKARLT